MKKILISTACLIAGAQASTASQQQESIFCNELALCQIFSGLPGDSQATLPDEIKQRCGLGGQEIQPSEPASQPQNQEIQQLELSENDVYMNALPKIIQYVEQETRNTCKQVNHMELESFKRHLEIPHIAKNYADFKAACERRTATLNTLQTGSREQQLEKIKEISASPEISRILLESKSSSNQPDPMNEDSWTLPL